MKNNKIPIVNGIKSLLLIVLAISLAHQATAEIRILQASNIGKVNLKSNDYSYAQGFQFRIKLNRDTISNQQLNDYINNLHLTTGSGQMVKGFDYISEENIIIGTSRQVGLSINHIERTAQGRHIFITSRNEQGKYTKLSAGEIGVYGTDGKSQCFEVKDVEKVDTTLLFDILVDRSGSMVRYIPAVRKAVTRFMSYLPTNARCRVTSFNDSYRRHTTKHQRCVAKNHGLSGLKAAGNTDIFTTLAAVYDDPERKIQTQQAVLIITDGIGKSKLTKADLQQKKNAATFVYWLGKYKENHLKGIADEYIYGRDDVKSTIDSYFQAIGDAVSEQQVIVTPRDCSAAEKMKSEKKFSNM